MELFYAEKSFVLREMEFVKYYQYNSKAHTTMQRMRTLLTRRLLAPLYGRYRAILAKVHKGR